MLTQQQMEHMTEAVARIREEIARAAIQAGRRPEEIQLCAACKTRTVEEVRFSAGLDIDVFGENHVQELVEKTDAGAYLGKPGHFIGHLQTNKVNKVVGRAALIHSVDSLRLMQKIHAAAQRQNLVQDILLEVNIGGEESKSGVMPEEVCEVAREIAKLPRLKLRGLMAIPEPAQDDESVRRPLRAMKALFDAHKAEFGWDTLSMGMSADMVQAVEEGATMVRVGSAIFGARHYPTKA